jgi:glucose/arabinose dehydrogenase
MMKTIFSVALAAMTLAATAGAQTIPNNVTFRNYFGTMVFNRPIQFLQYPGEDSVHIVLQQSGRIITVQRQAGDWVKTDSALITVNSGSSGGDERGLLGFAFHPQFTANGKYYVYYITGSGNGISLIAQRTATGPNKRPQTSDLQTTILRMTQPFSNHNGGTIGFGSDGKFYVAFGDGGSANDPGNRAQNLDTLFGKVLRLDVDGADAYPTDSTRNYAIPADNPFVGMANRRAEIWAYGLRNPYRWSFHPITGQMWIGDVGQNLFEEISRVPGAGANLGWPIQEGAPCFSQSSPNSPPATCNTAGHVEPAQTMQRSHANSITGGVVFTGDPASAYHGVYIFGDYGSNHVWAMRPSDGTLNDSVRIGQVINVVSFDRDSRGRVFATSLGTTNNAAANNTGIVYILESPDMVSGPVSLRHGRRPTAPAIRASDLLRNPGDYTVHGIDGRALRGAPAGVVLAAKRGAGEVPRLVVLP